MLTEAMFKPTAGKGKPNSKDHQKTTLRDFFFPTSLELPQGKYGVRLPSANLSAGNKAAFVSVWF